MRNDERRDSVAVRQYNHDADEFQCGIGHGWSRSVARSNRRRSIDRYVIFIRQSMRVSSAHFPSKYIRLFRVHFGSTESSSFRKLRVHQHHGAAQIDQSIRIRSGLAHAGNQVWSGTEALLQVGQAALPHVLHLAYARSDGTPSGSIRRPSLAQPCAFTP